MWMIALRAVAAVFVALAVGGCGGNQAGQPVAQDKQSVRSAKQASSPYASAVEQLYVAYFGRPADPTGLTNFENMLAAAGAPKNIPGLVSAYSTNKAVQALIDSFGTSAESQTLYGSGSTQDFVTAIFNNVLGRAPLASGLAYWSNAIDSGSLSKGDAALAIMSGELSNTTAQGLIDTQLIDNRLAVAASFTAQVASQGSTSFYSGAAAAAARNMLSTVDSTTDLSAFAATISSTIVTLLQSVPGISLVAGNTTAGIPLNAPTGMVRDSSGNLYFLDQVANVLDKVAPDGTFTYLAGSAGTFGSADGAGASASFYYPYDLAIDSKGNLYVADTANGIIRMVMPEGGVSTVAGQAGVVGSSDGTGASAKFYNPQGVAVDASGNLYVADTKNETIRKIAPGGSVSTYAGQAGKCGYADGVGNAAQFCNPISLVVDSAGNVYVTDSTYRTIRKIAPGGIVSTLAGNVNYKSLQDGTGSAAQFCAPVGFTFDNAGNLLVSDQGCYGVSNPAIRKVTPAGVVTTIAGNNGAAFAGRTPATSVFGGLVGLAADASGNIFAADYTNGSIWEVSTSGTVNIYACLYGVTGLIDGSTGAAAWFDKPQGIVADSAGNLYVADQLNDTIREVTALGQVTTLAGTLGDGTEQDGIGSAALFDNPIGLAIDANGNIYAMDGFASKVRIVSPSGATSPVAITSRRAKHYLWHGCRRGQFWKYVCMR